MLKYTSVRLFAMVLAAAPLAACGDSVAFRLCDEYGAPLHHGAINLRSGQVDVVAGLVSYQGILLDAANEGAYTGRTLAGRLSGSDGTALDCRIFVEENGTGRGTCAGMVPYQVRLRELPHM